jgi:hypothetical protein
VALTARQQQCIAAWQQLPAAGPARSHYRCRYVVVDVETTGINVRTDRLCAIGALALVDGQIDFKDALQLILAQCRTAAGRSGRPPRRSAGAGGRRTAVDALISFLHFVGKAPLVAYNVPFVPAMIERVLAEGLGIEFGATVDRSGVGDARSVSRCRQYAGAPGRLAQHFAIDQHPPPQRRFGRLRHRPVVADHDCPWRAQRFRDPGQPARAREGASPSAPERLGGRLRDGRLHCPAASLLRLLHGRFLHFHPGAGGARAARHAATLDRLFLSIS